jgi:MFS transporter, DHA1 family, multidrug resistance protein
LLIFIIGVLFLKYRDQKVILSILLGNIFIAFMGNGLIVPVMPSLMNELGLGGSTVGNLVAVFAFVQMIASPVAGKWVDQYGRKPIIVIGLFIFAFSEFLFGIAESVTVLLISRMLGGLGAAFIMPAVTAFIADITPLEGRTKALGYMSAAINTGFIVGPGIGGVLAEISPRMPFFVAAVIGGMAAILSLVLLIEPERNRTEDAKLTVRVGVVGSFRKILQPMYFYALFLIFVTNFALSAFESLLGLFADHKFQFSPMDIAIAIIGGGLFGVAAQIFLFDRMVTKLGEISVVRYSLFLSAVLTYIMTVVNTYISIIVVVCLVFVGFDLIRPAITSYLSKIAADEQGFVGGMNSMFTGMGNILGPIAGGILFDINFNFPLILSSLVLVFGMIIAMFWKKPESLAALIKW